MSLVSPGFLPILLTFLLQLACSGVGRAATIPTITLSDWKRIYGIGNRVALLEDPTGRLTLAEVVRRQASFTLSKQEVPLYGPTQSAIWCTFEVKNLAGQDWYLEVGTPFMPQIDLYRQTADEFFQHERLGALYPYAQRPVHTNQLIIPLQVPAGAGGRFYLRFQSNHTLGFPLRIASLQNLYESNQKGDLLNGMYFGLLLALIVYNLFVFIALRDKTYIYYILYVLCLGLNIAYKRGYGYQFVWPGTPALNSPNLFAGLGTLCTVLFTNGFLNTRYYIPRLRRLHWFIIVPVTISFILTIAGYSQVGFIVQLMASMLLIGYVFTIGIAVYRKGFTPARYYLLGFGSLIAGVLIFILKDIYLLPYNWLTEGGMQIGSALEAVILSFALVNKLQVYKEEKEQAQAKALQQANLFAHQLIETQEQERKRIAAELHDSVGQSLGLLKNRLLLLQQGGKDVPSAKLAGVTQSVAQTLQEVRQISYGLRPVQLDLLGLTKAIRSLIEETADGTDIHFYEDVDNIDSCFSKEAQMNVYRIVQECLSNMVKHAEATNGVVRINNHRNSVSLWIEDNGKGITQSSAVTEGSGLLGIRERLHLLGGSLQIKEAIPQGSIIDITIPVP